MALLSTTEKQREYSRLWYLRNKERLKPIRLAYAERTREARRAYLKEYERINAERISKRRKLHRQLNHETYREKAKKYKLANRTRILKWQKEYNRRTIKQRREYKRLRRASDMSFRIRETLAARISAAIKRRFPGAKSKKTVELLGCDIAFFKRYIENKFRDGMSWGNYGKWCFDHIMPCARFELSRLDEQLRCFHYSNLQPMWALENRQKSDKLPTPA